MKRLVVPEWLDDLESGDPRGVGSRRDLRRLNFCMGHKSIVGKALAGLLPAGDGHHIVELGAGDGSLLVDVASRWPKARITLLDRRPVVSEETCAQLRNPCVVTADVFDWLPGQPPIDCIVANLFLHHFDNEKFAQLLTLIANTANVFIACEPRRTTAALTASRFLWIAGCNAVTRHDAPISVRAGFRDGEITALWPDHGWQTSEGPAGLFSHLFTARRL